MSTGDRPDPNRRHSEIGLDGGLSEALVRTRRYFTKGVVSDDLRTLHRQP